ncbi:MAG: hypothetical protein AAFR11_05260 [Pseudomonadota bacterium]
MKLDLLAAAAAFLVAAPAIAQDGPDCGRDFPWQLDASMDRVELYRGPRNIIVTVCNGASSAPVRISYRSYGAALRGDDLNPGACLTRSGQWIFLRTQSADEPNARGTYCIAD